MVTKTLKRTYSTLPGGGIVEGQNVVCSFNPGIVGSHLMQVKGDKVANSTVQNLGAIRYKWTGGV
ncbi:MAG: hypothetical protein ABH950_03910, partial [Candidatus Altiarchaeota archaeon]